MLRQNHKAEEKNSKKKKAAKKSKTKKAAKPAAKKKSKKKKKLVLKKGVRVVLTGIDKKPEFNGLRGVISAASVEKKGVTRWPVKLDSDGSVKKLQAENLLFEEEVGAEEPAAAPELDSPPRPRDGVDLRSIAAKLPVGRSDAEREQRSEMFDGMDQNGSGQLSLAEIDLGVLNFVGEECFLMKPAIKEAYKAAKDVDPGDDKEDQHFVEKSEFRMLLVSLRRYLELYCAFDAVDTGNDDRINYEEFQQAVPLLGEWGIQVEDP